ncbi:MAG: alanine dehydrogenase [Oscillospiraceae bacterium]|nr:alanine dehydrogenase [Oscillospiraceae bacterium]
MIIGCVKEIKTHEYRVGLTPENVKQYALFGHTVYVQAGAGAGSSFSDEDYAAMGATILPAAKEIWEKSDMIVKVKEPLAAEYDLMQDGQILYTYLHLAADRILTEKLLEKRVKAVAYETIEDQHGGLPLLKPMSEIAGRMSVQVGARCLEKPVGGRGVLLAGVPGVARGKVVIIGGGAVGTSACKMAIGLGGQVTMIDNNLDRLTYLDDIFGQQIQTIYSTAPAIEAAVVEADLVIGAVLIPGAAAPKLIKREYLAKMKPGSVIVDVAVDQGGCCETTKMTYHDDPTFVVDDVIHYCVANMPGAVSRTSTVALTNATLRYGTMIANLGLEAALQAEPGLAPGVNCYGGQMTCRAVAEEFGLPYADVMLLI